MTRFAILTAIFLSIATAQDVPAPPKPADGPSLEATMQFIQDKLNGQGKVSFALTIHNSQADTVTAPQNRSETISDAEAVPVSCELSLHIADTEAADSESQIALSFRNVEKLVVLSLADAKKDTLAGTPWVTWEYAPAIFLLRIEMQQGKTARVINHYPAALNISDRDRRVSQVPMYFREEEIAQRVAKAMVHAVELCGSGGKEPF